MADSNPITEGVRFSNLCHHNDGSWEAELFDSLPPLFLNVPMKGRISDTFASMTSPALTLRKTFLSIISLKNKNMSWGDAVLNSMQVMGADSYLRHNNWDNTRDCRDIIQGPHSVVVTATFVWVTWSRVCVCALINRFPWYGWKKNANAIQAFLSLSLSFLASWARKPDSCIYSTYFCTTHMWQKGGPTNERK